MLIIAAIAYLTWSLLSEDKESIRKILLLTFLLGVVILILVHLSLRTLKNRVERLEKKNFKRCFKQTLVTDYFGHEMDEEEFSILK